MRGLVDADLAARLDVDACWEVGAAGGAGQASLEVVDRSVG